jgi:hypothetical protein
MIWLKRVEKLPWGLIGTILGLAFGIVGIYSYFYKNKPNVSFEIISEANVLDIHKPLKDLNIVFQGEDIQERNLNLRIFTIRIENSGNVDILQNYYDSDDIWGFEVEKGKIIEVRCVNSNSEYLNLNLNPKLYKEDTVQFTKLIFEKGKFFTIEILVLHIKDKLPTIIPIGKIAGIDRIVPIKSWLEKERGTFWSKLFAGNTLIQIARSFFYLIAWIAFIVIVIFFGIGISKLMNETKIASRRKKIKRYFGKKALEVESDNKRLLDIYVKEGPAGVKRLQKYLEDEERMRSRINYYEYIKKRNKEKEEGKLIEKMPEYYDYDFEEKVLPPLIENAIITIGSDQRIHMAPELQQTLDKLLRLEKIKEK